MRPAMTSLAMLTIGACANSTEPSPPYDNAARILGAEVATLEGGSLAAIADIANLAHGGMPRGFHRTPLHDVRGTHDGIDYVYVVWCHDSNGKLMTSCGETTVSAHAIAGWGGNMQTSAGPLLVWHHGVWDLQGLHGGIGWTNGTSWATYDHDRSMYVTLDAQLVFDFSTLMPRGGAMEGAIEVFDPTDGSMRFELESSVVFDRPERPTLLIDDQRYWLDTTTGEVTAATVLE